MYINSFRCDCKVPFFSPMGIRGMNSGSLQAYWMCVSRSVSHLPNFARDGAGRCVWRCAGSSVGRCVGSYVGRCMGSSVGRSVRRSVGSSGGRCVGGQFIEKMLWEGKVSKKLARGKQKIFCNPAYVWRGSRLNGPKPTNWQCDFLKEC